VQPIRNPRKEEYWQKGALDRQVPPEGRAGEYGKHKECAQRSKEHILHRGGDVCKKVTRRYELAGRPEKKTAERRLHVLV